MNGAQWYWLAIAVAALLMVFGNANSGPLADPLADPRAFRAFYQCPSNPSETRHDNQIK